MPGEIWTRSLLAIISMAFAAAFLAYLLTLGRGYSQGAGQPLRQMLGGEITIYRQKLISEQPGSKQDWQFRLEAPQPFDGHKFFLFKIRTIRLYGQQSNGRDGVEIHRGGITAEPKYHGGLPGQSPAHL